MKKHRMKLFKILMILVLFLGNVITGISEITVHAATTDNEIQQSMNSAAQHLLDRPVHHSNNDWTIFALSRSSIEMSRERKLEYYEALQNGVVSRWGNHSITDISRMIIAAVALGADPTDIGGKDLVNDLLGRSIPAANNMLAFMIIALDTLNFDLNAFENTPNFTRDELVTKLIAMQGVNGDWGNDVDRTGMAMTALANYRHREDVVQSVDKGAAFIQERQLENGGFNSFGMLNSNSSSQALMGLAVNGINPNAENFVRGENTIISVLLDYQLPEDGGFKWLPGDTRANLMSTEQALYALAQYQFFRAGKGSIYDFVSNPVPPIHEEIPVVNKEDLNELVVAAEAIEKNNYSEEAWELFLSILNDAITIMESKDATQEEVDRAFSQLTEAKARLIPTELETDEEIAEAPIPGETPTPEIISVKLEIDGRSEAAGKEVIVPETIVEIEHGQTAADVIEKVLTQKNIEFINRGGNYIAMVGGLAEFDGGDFSGWMYRVNGVLPPIGIAEFELEAGDSILLFFTDDFREIDFGLPENGGNEQPPVADEEIEDPGSDEVEVPATVLTAIEDGIQFILNQGTLYSDWESLAVARSGVEIPAEMQMNRLEEVRDFIQNSSRITVTDYARTIIGLVALGQDPTDFAGRNLVEELYQMQPNAINGMIFSLIALDTKDYEIPTYAPMQREQLLAEILENQAADGGWSLLGPENPSDADITGMAMTALSNYGHLPEVQVAIDQGAAFLSSIQTENGGFASMGSENSNSVAQVLMGLTTNDIDPTSERFTQNGKNVVDSLLSYQLTDGGFKWLQSDTANNGMALEQAMYALIQYQFFLEGNGSIFDFTENPVDSTEPLPNNGNGSNKNQGDNQNNQGNNQNNNQNNNKVNNQGDKERILPRTGQEFSQVAWIGLAMLGLGSAIFIHRQFRKKSV